MCVSLNYAVSLIAVYKVNRDYLEDYIQLDDHHNALLTIQLFIQTKQAAAVWVHGSSGKRYEN